MTLPAERFNLTPIHSTGDSAMFDFDDLEAKSPSEASGEDPIDYRGEDAHERCRIAELKMVQENVRKIDAVDDDDDDGDCPYLDGQFSDTEDVNSANAPFVPGCRAEKVRVRNRVRRRQQPDRVPSSAWLEPEEETAPSARIRPGWSSPLLMRHGKPKRRRSRIGRYLQSVILPREHRADHLALDQSADDD